MRAWVVVGCALVLVGFAVTLALDLLAARPEVADLPATPPPARVEVEGARGVVLEREAGTAQPASKRPPADVTEGAAGSTRPLHPREEVRRNADGSVRERLQLDESGAPHGAYASFRPDGAPLEVGAYDHGRKQGLWRSFHGNGALREETTWDAGAQRGTLRQWDLEGHLVREARMDGELEGPCTTWYADGQTESRGAYSGGRREGRWDFWQPNGALDAARSGLYRADQRVGD